jgi:hypothetical protein
MSSFALSSSDLAAIKPDSLHKDNYVSLLETRLAKARHRILILEANCAMLGDTGDDISPPAPPASPAPSLQRNFKCCHKSATMRPSQTNKISENCLHGQKSTSDSLAPGATTPRNSSTGSLSWHGPSVSLLDEPTPCPIKKAVPGHVESLPPPATKPYTAEPHFQPETPPAGRATSRLLSGSHIPHHLPTRPKFMSENITSGIPSQTRPARRGEHSTQATSICTAGSMKYLCSRRRYSGRQSLTSN